MEKNLLKKIMSLGILIVLLVLSYLLLKPILMSIIFGIILAFLFTPLYKKLNKKIKRKNLSATIICILFLILIIVPLWFLVPALLDQSIEIYMASQKLDLVTPVKNLFPNLFQEEMISNEISSVLYNLVTKATNGAMEAFSNILINFPTILLQMLVALFTFYFVMRDHEEILKYIQSIMPFSKEVETKLFKSTKDLTYSILYGQIIIGFLQGIFLGISFFLFGINNALFLTLLACIAGIVPMIGTNLIWIPLVIYSLINGQFVPAMGITLFGLVELFFENVTKPVIVSKKANVHSGVVLLGMIGGILLFGILGMVLGPLILSYLLIVLEIYRDKKTPGYLIQDSEDEKLDIKMSDF